jgi:choline dehydrogenase
MHDYIIVGAGSAGCVLAARLSQDPHNTVLLLEAGGSDRRAQIHTPIAFSKLFKSDCDWAYNTEPQPHLNNRRLFWPRGKMLGGSSSMNAMIHIRGNRRDFDRWYEFGNVGWSWADVHPYFDRIQVNVSDLKEVNPLSRAFLQAAIEAGYAANEDFNGPEQDGFGFYRVAQRDGKRHSAAAAYLKPALRRANLKVLTGAHVTQVLIRDSRATGVAYRRNGAMHRADAAGEVILCGGAVNSPQLLMLSGVGPSDHLRSLGIPVVADLPGVGENLQDHLAVPVSFRCSQPISLKNAESVANILKYIFLKTGPLTSNVAEAGGFVRTRPQLASPNLQFHFAPAFYVEHGFRSIDDHAFTIGPTMLRPRSRGSVRLRSADPLEVPAIDPNYLADDGDFEVLFDGVKLARRLAAAKAFDAYRGPELLPGTLSIEDHIRSSADTLYHPVGTCKMGNDEMAVVDAQLRVRGVAGLRVADASVMPEIVGGNTNAATLMIAEKAAASILPDNSLKQM